MDSNDKDDELSKANIFEAEFTFVLIKALLKLTNLEKEGISSFKNQIGIVTPYKG